MGQGQLRAARPRPAARALLQARRPTVALAGRAAIPHYQMRPINPPTCPHPSWPLTRTQPTPWPCGRAACRGRAPLWATSCAAPLPPRRSTAARRRSPGRSGTAAAPVDKEWPKQMKRRDEWVRGSHGHPERRLLRLKASVSSPMWACRQPDVARSPRHKQPLHAPQRRTLTPWSRVIWVSMPIWITVHAS